jgi:hypothetical protein
VNVKRLDTQVVAHVVGRRDSAPLGESSTNFKGRIVMKMLRQQNKTKQNKIKQNKTKQMKNITSKFDKSKQNIQILQNV